VHRRRVDLWRVAAGLGVLIGAGIAAHLGRPSVVEINLFRLINQLPSALDAPLLGVMQIGALAAVPVLAAAVALAGRYRLASVVALAGTLAWSAAKLAQFVVDEEAPQLRLSRVVLHGGVAPGLAFPASHVAVAAALTVAAGPYLGRSGRRMAWLVTGLIAVARVYVGVHLPIDVVGGLGLGVAAGSLTLLVLGTPVLGSAPDQVRRLLAIAGIGVTAVDPVGAGGQRVRCLGVDGDVYLAKVLDWDAPDQGWLSRVWRLAAYREVYAPVTPASPAHRADRAAHAMLLAQRGGVRCPDLVATPDLGHQISLVVRRWVDGTALAELPDERLDDEVVEDAFAQLAALHAAGVVHRGLGPDHLLVDGDGRVWMLGWGAARATPSLDDRASDRAELLVVLAARVGAQRAVDAAGRVLTPALLVDTLAHLQPLALAPDTRRTLAGRPAVLADVRDRIGALAGVTPPQPLSPTRVALSNLGPIAAGAAAVLVLLPRLVQSSNSASVLAAAQWPWLVAVAGAAACTYLLAAVALTAAAGVRLDLGRTYVVQLAASCANRVTPAGLGAAATNIRYLELTGIDRPEATCAIGMTAVSGFVVHTIGTVVAVAALQTGAFNVHVPELEHAWPALLGLGLAGIGIGWVVWARRLHTTLIGWLCAGGRSVKAICLRPRRAAVLLAASAGISGCYILALDASLRAFGAHPGLVVVAGIYLGSSAVGALAPTPGGIGPFEAAAVAGLGGAGVAAGPAVAAVIAYRLLTYWLPVAPGAVALHRLRRRGVL
jgi:uncharacterized membrane protein YbhN (UPF0104 family)/membrane-associated phospholipid phosphatase